MFKAKIKDYLSAITGVFETLCAGAIIYGWSSLNYVLTKEGYFNSSCNNSLYVSPNSSDFICPKQQYDLGLVFTLAVTIPPGLCIFTGKFLDHYGTWALRSINSVLFTASCVAIAFSSSSTSWILYPATIVINLCGYVIIITNTQIANLFPHYRGFVTNVMSGALNTSLGVFTLIKIANEHGYSLKFLFLLMSGLGPFMLFRTFFLMPKLIIPSDVANDYYYGVQELCGKSNNSSEETILLLAPESTDESESAPAKLKSYVFSLLYFFGVLSFSIQVLRMNFFIEALNVKLLALFPHNHSVVSYNINFFGIVHALCLFISPLFGVMVDYLDYKYKKRFNTFQAKMKTLTFQNLLASLVVITYSILRLISSSTLQYVSYILIIVSENLAYANVGLFVLQCFPMKYFGILYGLSFLSGAIVTSLQFPLYFAAIHYFHSNFLIIDIFLLILAIITMIHPIDLYQRSKI